MLEHITTPFGRRPLTAAQIEAQTVAASCPAEATIDKWVVLRAIATARGMFGLADRSVAVLSALLSFYPETALQADGDGRIVVFPSNLQLRHRAHGIAETTLRQHLSVLVEAGIVIRRDSPNGKRYARRGEGGAVAQAFGFDLAPLVARAVEFTAAAERIEADRRTDRLARERVSLLRRDVGKLLEWAAGSGAPGPWDAMTGRFRALVGALPRRPTTDMLDAIEAGLTRLLAEAHNCLDAKAISQNLDGSDRQIERQHQNSKPDDHRIKTAIDKKHEEPQETRRREGGAPSVYPLPMVMEACPDISDYARGGIRTWSDLVSTADLVRSLLGISPTAWKEAREVMGPEAAAVTVAAILQRSGRIRSPGGYLRSLVERKRAGRFSLGPVLQALNRGHLTARSSSG